VSTSEEYESGGGGDDDDNVSGVANNGELLTPGKCNDEKIPSVG
jgi:hypothetical protein